MNDMVRVSFNLVTTVGTKSVFSTQVQSSRYSSKIF